MILPGRCYGSRGGNPVRFIVNHVAVGNGSLFGWFTQSGLSTHYWVGKNGDIEQYVPLSMAAWGQGLVTPGSDFPPEYPGDGYTYNQMAVCIEREGYPNEVPTLAQWHGIVALNRWLATRYSLPVDRDHIVGHYRSDYRNRAECPSANAEAYMERLIAAVGGG